MIIIMVIIIMITIISSPPQTLASDHMRHKGDQGSELSPQSGSTYTDCTQPGTCRIHYFRICFEIFICCVKTFNMIFFSKRHRVGHLSLNISCPAFCILKEQKEKETIFVSRFSFSSLILVS